MKSFESAISLLGNLFSAGGTALPASSAPISTRYRHIKALRKSGLIFRAGPDQYLPQPAFLQLLESFNRANILADVVRPAVRTISTNLNCTAHFGILEGDMVTYVVKESAVPQSIFTKEGQQLEAYCSAIGKVLLAGLNDAEIDTYLSTGPFPALTGNTLTDPDSIRRVLQNVRSVNYAVDDAEIHERLYCLSVPVPDGLGRVVGALSASSNHRDFIQSSKDQVLVKLNQEASQICKLLS